MEKTETPKPKNVLAKLKEGLDDKEEQLEILSTFVRLGVVVWAGFIISLNYVEIPGLGEQTPKDITFIASIFTSVIGSFGLNINKKDKNAMTKADMEQMIAKANSSQGYQTIRVVTPLQINGAEVVEPTNANE